MTETAPEAPAGEQTPPEGEQQTEPKTFDADYVDKLRKEAAKYRTEAKANADAAKRLAQIEESNKTELQKATERAAAAEKTAADAARLRVAVLKGYSGEQALATADLLRGDSEDELTAHLDRLISSGVLAAAGVSTKPTGSADGGARGNAGESGNFTEWVRQQAGIT